MVKRVNEEQSVKDWRIKDNLIICLNLINKDIMKKDLYAKLKTLHEVTKDVKKIAKLQKCSLLDASFQYKKQLKEKYNE